MICNLKEEKFPLKILTIVDSLDEKDIVFLWHIASRFKEWKVKLFVGIKRAAINPFTSERLLFKFYNMEKNGYDVNVRFLTVNEVGATLQKYDLSDYKKCLEEYIKKTASPLEKNFVLFINRGTIFSQTPPESMFDLIRNDTVFFFADGYGYLKDLDNYKETGWTNLSNEYPLIDRELKNTDFYVAATFTDAAQKTEYYRSWFAFVEQKFMNGEEMFPYEH